MQPSTNRSSSEVDISVCIATFERPQGLARLLASLEPLARANAPRVEIVVVDNAASASARATVAAWKDRFARLRYFVEPEQNISHARNRAVAEATGHWLAFIDDDEIAAANWLSAYWKCTSEHPADGYFGPVTPLLEGNAPAWLDPQRFLAFPRPAHGALLGVQHTRTTNALIRRECFASRRFDPAYGITGGGDYELFGRMLDTGAVFRWCDGAESFEYYASNRLTLRWLLQRAFRGGNTYTLVDRQRTPQLAWQARQLAKAVVGVVVFACAAPLALCLGRTQAVVCLQRLFVQLGHIWAFLGGRYEEYRTAQRSIEIHRK